MKHYITYQSYTTNITEQKAISRNVP